MTIFDPGGWSKRLSSDFSPIDPPQAGLRTLPGSKQSCSTITGGIGPYGASTTGYHLGILPDSDPISLPDSGFDTGAPSDHLGSSHNTA